GVEAPGASSARQHQILSAGNPDELADFGGVDTGEGLREISHAKAQRRRKEEFDPPLRLLCAFAPLREISSLRIKLLDQIPVSLVDHFPFYFQRWSQLTAVDTEFIW